VIGGLGDDVRARVACRAVVGVDVVDVDEGPRRGPRRIGDRTSAELGHPGADEHHAVAGRDLCRPDGSVVVPQRLDLGETEGIDEEAERLRRVRVVQVGQHLRCTGRPP